MFLQICTSGAEAPSFLCFIAARLKPCPETNPRFCATPGAEPDSGSGFAARLEAAPFQSIAHFKIPHSFKTLCAMNLRDAIGATK
jgi:hypothetical protein